MRGAVGGHGDEILPLASPALAFVASKSRIFLIQMVGDAGIEPAPIPLSVRRRLGGMRSACTAPGERAGEIWAHFEWAGSHASASTYEKASISCRMSPEPLLSAKHGRENCSARARQDPQFSN
jgi:hypothetical protein